MSEGNKPTARVHDLQLLLTLPVTIIGAGNRIAHVPEQSNSPRLTLDHLRSPEDGWEKGGVGVNAKDLGAEASRK
jgi:hypothetical protein